ncbi:hypothetical protein N7522_003412 [Penicillium canescens]|nr:hypothetical protein N7522_003412 [Penicillium canescens]
MSVELGRLLTSGNQRGLPTLAQTMRVFDPLAGYSSLGERPHTTAAIRQATFEGEIAESTRRGDGPSPCNPPDGDLNWLMTMTWLFRPGVFGGPHRWYL